MAQLATRGVQLTYLGDLDAAGIRMADTLKQALPTSPQFLALQTPKRVLQWLIESGKVDALRTRRQPVRDPALAREMDSVVTQARFVEQEQLLAQYEALIAAWLRR